MFATLGGLLKDLRLQKNISQLEISFAVGWKEPSRLSRIEQGHVSKPKRALLNRLMDAMKLSEEEKGKLLLAGGYVPTDEEVMKIRKVTADLLQEWDYPVFVFDFSWRIVAGNASAKTLYQIDSLIEGSLEKSMPNILEVIFHPEFPSNKYLKGKDLSERHEFLSNVLFHFKHLQTIRMKEAWYTNLISKMMDNDLFRSLWQQKQKEEYQPVATNYGVKTLLIPDTISKKLDFNFFIVPVIYDARFNIEFHIPKNIETFKYYVK